MISSLALKCQDFKWKDIFRRITFTHSHVFHIRYIYFFFCNSSGALVWFNRKKLRKIEWHFNVFCKLHSFCNALNCKLPVRTSFRVIFWLLQITCEDLRKQNEIHYFVPGFFKYFVNFWISGWWRPLFILR